MRRRPLVHLVNPMWNAAGGSEQRTVALCDRLSRSAEVRVWSEHVIAPALAARLPIRSIGRPEGPKHGTLVLVGCYFDLVGPWIHDAQPERVILVVTTAQAGNARHMKASLEAATGKVCELVFASAAVRDGLELPGRVEYSPIDLQDFQPATRKPGEPFTVGRVSRDAREKHHEEDPIVYAELLEQGARVRLMGAQSAVGSGGFLPVGIELVAADAGPGAVGAFLGTLDCFFYRTSAFIFEAYGRVVAEAMAMGLCVVLEQRGGYTEIVRHLENGLMFSTTREALAWLEIVRLDPERRKALGEAARQTISDLYGPSYWRELEWYYLGR